jgi:hypothetical protein
LPLERRNSLLESVILTGEHLDLMRDTLQLIKGAGYVLAQFRQIGRRCRSGQRSVLALILLRVPLFQRSLLLGGKRGSACRPIMKRPAGFVRYHSLEFLQRSEPAHNASLLEAAAESVCNDRDIRVSTILPSRIIRPRVEA